MAQLRDFISMGTAPSGKPLTSGTFMEDVVKKWQEFEDRKAKKRQEETAEYIQLRKAGYSKDQAYKKIRGQNVGMPQEDPMGTEQKASELDLKKKKMDILETKEDVKKKIRERNAGMKGEYENPDDIPEDSGGTPLYEKRYNPKTGKWYGVYRRPTTSSSGVDQFNLDLDKLDTEASRESGTTTNPIRSKGMDFMRSLFGLAGPLGEGAYSIFGPKKGQQQTDTGFTEDEENMIRANMEHYGKSRAEVIQALHGKGYL